MIFIAPSGGSGYVAFTQLTMFKSRNFTVTVGLPGSGGAGTLNSATECNLVTGGGASSFDTFVVAQGGFTTSDNSGAAGGSGGVGSVMYGGLREPGNILAARIITVGQDYAAPGQAVVPVPEEAVPGKTP